MKIFLFVFEEPIFPQICATSEHIALAFKVYIRFTASKVKHSCNLISLVYLTLIFGYNLYLFSIHNKEKKKTVLPNTSFQDYKVRYVGQGLIGIVCRKATPLVGLQL